MQSVLHSLDLCVYIWSRWTAAASRRAPRGGGDGCGKAQRALC